MAENIDIIKTQKEFINILLKNKDLVGDWLDSNMPEIKYFDEQFEYILKAIKYSYDNDVLLTRKTFLDYLYRNISNRSLIPANETMFNIISAISANRDDFPVIKQEIVESYLVNVSIKSIEVFKNDLVVGKNKSLAVKKLISNVADLNVKSNESNKAIYESISSYSSEYLKSLEDIRNKKTEQVINTCGIKEIDETLPVGFAPGEIVLFCGDTGSYKSTMMLNVSYNMWLKGQNVLFIPLEMPRNLFYNKLLSRHSKVPFERIMKPSILIEDEWKKIKEASEFIEKFNSSQFFILDNLQGAKISTIRKEIERHIDIFKPNVVVLDYICIGHLKPEDNKLGDRPDIQIGQMLKDLKHMGKAGAVHKDGFCLVSGAQIGREANKRIRKLSADKMGFYSEDLRNSQEYSTDATNIYAQIPDPTQPKSRLSFFCIKSRYGTKVFSNGETRASLSVRPEISLIESIDNSWQVDKSKDILNKTEDKSIDVFADLDIKSNNSKVEVKKISYSKEEDVIAEIESLDVNQL